MNEIRNELLLIKSIMTRYNTEEEKYDRQIDLERLLERFEYDIKDQLKDIQYKEQELLDNLKTLEYVRKELRINEK